MFGVSVFVDDGADGQADFRRAVQASGSGDDGGHLGRIALGGG